MATDCTCQRGCSYVSPLFLTVSLLKLSNSPALADPKAQAVLAQRANAIAHSVLTKHTLISVRAKAVRTHAVAPPATNRAHVLN
ncbi:hypothetical protein JR316_0009254 [Psilocybe cubensis]|uniref:Uncharacterized protein n=1 Tax=Psilocybe cubensis TaxID=181762 RepID=A0ACB8GT21_PSICU|nr:hypothetical protein JR316_0009254 [Psilocybe cubensis]KAH9478793.1 hypothetical protein JR316_0009254 [Psilocybe cubensis]